MAQAEACYFCGRHTPVPGARVDGRPVCHACYGREYVAVSCTQCGKPTRCLPMVKGAALCRSCRPRPPCIRCGKGTNSRSMQTPDGPVCSACRRFFEAEQPCPACGRLTRYLARNHKLGHTMPVCNRCQTAGHKTCSQCRKYRPVHAHDETGRPLCIRCADEAPFICPECGQPGQRHSNNRCHTCYFRSAALHKRDALAQALRRPWVREAWSGFVTHLLAKALPSGKLARMLERQVRLFEALDALFPTPLSIRPEVLVETLGRGGMRRVVTAYNYLLERGQFRPIPDDLLAKLTEEATRARLMERMSVPWKRQLLERYLGHLARTGAAYQKKGWNGQRERFAPRTVTLLLRAAFKFLAFLPEEVTAVQGIDRFQLDRFVAHKPGHRNALHSFVHYLNRFESLFQRLHLDRTGPRSGPPPFLVLPQEASDALLQRWLAADEQNLRNALLGLLMLVYARTAKQAVGLRRGDFTLGADGAVTVRFGQLPVELDEAVADIFVRYLGQLEQAQGRALAMEDWLFPGRTRGRALTTHAITYGLSQHGVKAEQLFSTAIVNFYRNGLTKPKVLVRALGISLPTALDYWQLFAPQVAEEVAYRAGRG